MTVYISNGDITDGMVIENRSREPPALPLVGMGDGESLLDASALVEAVEAMALDASPAGEEEEEVAAAAAGEAGAADAEGDEKQGDEKQQGAQESGINKEGDGGSQAL